MRYRSMYTFTIVISLKHTSSPVSVGNRDFGVASGAALAPSSEACPACELILGAALLDDHREFSLMGGSIGRWLLQS